MRTRICMAVLAAALVGPGCTDRPGDRGNFPTDPGDGIVFNLHVVHHSLSGVASTASPHSGSNHMLNSIWEDQCFIKTSTFADNNGALMGVDYYGRSTRLGERFDYIGPQGILTSNINTLRNNLKFPSSTPYNRGVEIFYSHNVYAGSDSIIPGITVAARVAVVQSGEKCTQSYCNLVAAHELGHMLNLVHRDSGTTKYVANQWLMNSGAKIGPNIEGKQTSYGSVVSFPTGKECYIARRYGLYNNYFEQPRPAGMTP